MKTYKEFIIKAEPFIPDIISSILWELEFQGLTEEDNFIKAYSESKDISRVDIEIQLNKLIQQNLISAFSVEENEIAEKNWNEEWEKSIDIIKATDRIVIKPTFKEYIAVNDEIVITIDPKMSFGTGHHQTTRLILKMLEKYVKPGSTVLDAGTGTGILAIAAVKLGAAYALGFDNDEWCYENGIENCSLNNLSKKVEIKLAEIGHLENKKYDLILANINKNILLEIGNELVNFMHNETVIILSGLLYTDEQDIIKYYNTLGLSAIEKDQMDEWITLIFKK